MVNRLKLSLLVVELHSVSHRSMQFHVSVCVYRFRLNDHFSASFMSITGCQVEPVDSLYEWEKEPLPIIKEGCQADHVGLVCPPERTDFGIRVTVESFRYQTTAQVQYTCLVRVCPFSPCPQVFLFIFANNKSIFLSSQMKCPIVEGCSTNELLAAASNGIGSGRRHRRMKRQLTIEQIRAAIAANPHLSSQIGNLPSSILTGGGGGGRSSDTLQQHLARLGGDHIVKKRLIVVNSENELQYYVRTGNIPQSFAGRR